MEAGSPPTFGHLLRHYRVTAGLTQEELAERARVSVRTIGDIERGVSALPHKNTVGLLVRALELTAAECSAFEVSARRRPVATRTPAWPVELDRSESNAAETFSAPLVGRTLEVALLERHLEGIGPPLLVLGGEPGVGKSRLLAEAVQNARNSGWSVLEGGCQRRGSQEPFAPVVNALANFLRPVPTPLARELLHGCIWLVRLLPELTDAMSDTLPAWVLAPDQERRLMFEAVARLLYNIARQSEGVLLVLDDLQWAASDAFELLTALLQPGVNHPHLRILAAYRDNEVSLGDALAVTLADWAHADVVAHHTLAPLQPHDCEHLLDALLARSELRSTDPTAQRTLRERLLQRAGGVPFFLVSYAHALHRGDIESGADAVPWDVAQGVRQRVAALPVAARRQLSAAAVIGRVFQPALLFAVVDQPEEEVLAGLDAACRARLLIDTGNGYQFAHDVIREVVELDSGSARRAVLHRRAAIAIEGQCADRLADYYETLAHHYIGAEVWEKALEYLDRSGDKATGAGAIREALNFYGQALATCARLGAQALLRAGRVAEKRGFVHYDSGDFDAAVADFDRMRAAASDLGDRRREGLALAYAGMAAYYGHEFDVAEGMLGEALEVAAEGFDDTRLFASIQLSSLLMITGRHTEAVPLLQVAETLAPIVNDPLSHSWWAITGCEVLHWGGCYAESIALLERWQDSVVATKQLLMLLWTKWENALACGGSGKYARALQLLDEVMTTCADTGESFIRARALNTAGWIHCELQDHQRALELNGESLALANAIETVDTEIRSNARLNLGDSCLALGRLEEAQAHFQSVEHIVRNPRPHDRWMLWRYAQHLFHSYGSLRLAQGDLDAALAYADDCLQGATASDSPKNVVKARRLRGEVLLRRGQLSDAAAELHAALEVAQRIGNPPQLWRTHVTLAELYQAEQDRAAAARAYRQAVNVINAVSANLHEPLRQRFLESAHIRTIWQHAEPFLGEAEFGGGPALTHRPARGKARLIHIT